MHADIVLAGGGLANGLIALRLAHLRPAASVLVIEKAAEIGGNHTWSFHEGDVTAAQEAWLAPLIAHRWAAQEVHFPGRRRTFQRGYRSLTSERFRQVLGARLGTRLLTGRGVRHIDRAGVVLDDGTHITAGAVIDGRGQCAATHFRAGLQKFVGLELVLDQPHGLTQPMIMDATVAQTDGFRFVYVLPLAPDRVLVEDTYYSAAPGLDDARVEARVLAYAARRGWTVARIARRERGILPVIMAGDLDAFFRAGIPGVTRTGLAAGLVHPVTGYSLPDAVRVADLIAGLSDVSGAAIERTMAAHIRRRWAEQGFLRLLSRMLFLAAEPDERWRVLRRFYGLPDGLIARFFAGCPTLPDKMRTLVGRPPVPMARALPLLFERRVMRKLEAWA